VSQNRNVAVQVGGVMVGKYQARTYTIENVTFVEFDRAEQEETCWDRMDAAIQQGRRLLAGLEMRIEELQANRARAHDQRAKAPCVAFGRANGCPARKLDNVASSQVLLPGQETSLA
jgi:hypothetical protein